MRDRVCNEIRCYLSFDVFFVFVYKFILSDVSSNSATSFCFMLSLLSLSLCPFHDIKRKAL